MFFFGGPSISLVTLKAVRLLLPSPARCTASRPRAATADAEAASDLDTGIGVSGMDTMPANEARAHVSASARDGPPSPRWAWRTFASGHPVSSTITSSASPAAAMPRTAAAASAS